MVFSADDRGQAIVVGAVLIFGILVISLALYQSQIVPAENRQIEFDHHQTVQQRMVDLRTALLTSAVSGEGRPAAIPLGTRYPTRVFSVNPPPPAAELRTDDLGTITLSNVVATDDDVADYLNGSDVTVSTAALTYDPDYSELQRPTSFVYESSLLYSSLPGTEGATFVEGFTGQEIIDGSTINLVALQGNLSESGSQSVSVEPTVLSGGFTAVQVTNASGGPVNLTLPTQVPVDTWRELVDSPRVQSLTSVRDGDAVRFVLEPGTYTLKMAKLGVGTGATDPGPHYVVPVGSNRSSVGEETSRELTFEVRDRYNNPVANAEVNLTGNESLTGTLRGPNGNVLTASDTVRTDEDGRVNVVYEAPEVNGSGLTERIAANISGDPKTDPDPEYASIAVSVINSDGSGTGTSGGGGGTINPKSGDLIVYQGVSDHNDSTVTVILENLDTDDFRFIDQVKFSFFSADEQGQAAADLPDEMTIEGENVRLQRNGEFETVSMSFEPGQRRSVNMTFYKDDSEYTKITPGDFFVLSVIYGNGSSTNFFISPSSSTTGPDTGGGGGGSGTTFNSTTVTDNTNTSSSSSTDIDYNLSYQVNGTDFRNVEVVVQNEDGDVQETFNSTAQVDSFRYQESRSGQGVQNQQYTFVFRIYDNNGNVVHTVNKTDSPDGN